MSELLLDLFCGGGGCTRGYQQAGFTVIGVDVAPQPRYVGSGFIQRDAIDWLRWAAGEAGEPAWFAHLIGYHQRLLTKPGRFTVVHASPPCTDHTQLKAVNGVCGTGWMLAEAQRLLPKIHDLHGCHWVVENVPLADMPGAVTICGASMGCWADTTTHGQVWLKRHRLFQSSVPLMIPPCNCGGVKKLAPVYGHMGHAIKSDGQHKRIIRGPGTTAACRMVMGIDWMNNKELVQAIPPAYTRMVGNQIRDYLEATR